MWGLEIMGQRRLQGVLGCYDGVGQLRRTGTEVDGYLGVGLLLLLLADESLQSLHSVGTNTEL